MRASTLIWVRKFALTFDAHLVSLHFPLDSFSSLQSPSWGVGHTSGKHPATLDLLSAPLALRFVIKPPFSANITPLAALNLVGEVVRNGVGRAVGNVVGEGFGGVVGVVGGIVGEDFHRQAAIDVVGDVVGAPL